MPTIRKQDRRRFKAALTQQGTTLTAFASQAGVTHTHLNYVLRGERRSPRLEQAIARVIADAAKRGR